MQSLTISVAPSASLPVASPIRRSAEALEATFLSEMLKAAGFGAAAESMCGGVGEQHFASFMADAHARALVARGGIGLAGHIETAMLRRAADGAA